MLKKSTPLEVSSDVTSELLIRKRTRLLTGSILQKVLAVLARAAIRKYNPIIVGITGSVGKTSIKEAIYAVLKNKYRVGKAEKNYNNEIGLPLSILGIPHCGKNIFKWVFILLRPSWRILHEDKNYPEILILEYGVDRPGDMDYLLSIAKPKIAVVTAIGDIPVHVEFFKNPEQLIEEKAKLVQVLPVNGFAVLNHDDYAVYDMKEKTKARVITYGQEEHADLKVMNYELRTKKDPTLNDDIPEGISFKVEYAGSVVPIRLQDAFGLPQTYAASAAAAVGLVLNLNLVEISEALHNYTPPSGRLRLLRGIKNSFILDDTYNASPESMRLALDTLKELPAKRKIAVLGDMLEIGRYTEQAHRAVGDQAGEFIDLLFTVGPRAKFIADEVLTSGLERIARQLESNQVFKFDDSLAAGRALDPLIQPGDLILVKGSQATRMERAVEEIMAHPEKTKELLVRQEDYWKAR